MSFLKAILNRPKSRSLLTAQSIQKKGKSLSNIMVTRHKKPTKPFDALAFEEERYQIFQNIGIEPTEAQWLDSEYRASYIQAISKRSALRCANKLDEKYGLV